MAAGKVFLVGAGPGDPELITLRGVQALARADVVVYDGLANALLLEHAPDRAERIYAGKKHSEHGQPLTQEQIEQLLVERATAGQTVVRLKGGDPFVFGRGGEEAERLVAAGIPFEVIPGVSAIAAVPAYAGIPLTHRDVASTVVAVATGQEEEDRARVDWSAVARADTIVLFMAVKTLAEVAAQLIAAGRDPATPAAAIRWGTTPAQETVVAPLVELAAAVVAAGLRPPALIIIGPVVAYRERLRWFERRPLFGRSVLIPRQRGQSRALIQRLIELGAEPVLGEVTRTVAVEPELLDAALQQPARWIAFTSAHAVAASWASVRRRGGDARSWAGVRLASVGAATAAALAEHGLHADLVPSESNAEGLARALLAADPGLVGSRLLLPRAAEGRDELVAILGAAGVSVAAVAAYRTAVTPLEDWSHAAERLRAGNIDIATFFAPSQVDAVVAGVGVDALARVGVRAAIGPTTAAALARHGLIVDVISAAPSAEVLAAELAARFVEES